MNLRRSVLAFFGLSLTLTAVAGPLHAQAAATTQQANMGSLTGIVTDQASGQPLPLAEVAINGTAFGARSGNDGRYTITNIPPSIYQLTVRRPGYAASTIDNVRIVAGANTRNIAMSQSSLTLAAVVSAGLSDPGSGRTAAFSVAKISGEALEVPGVGNPLEVLQGRVAGLQIRGGTRPGSDAIIQIRNPLSISGYTQPLIIVDGVIQMQNDPSLGARAFNGDMLDLNGDNIESIEVVRGASAAALYGDRAANGVIIVTTKRGGDLAVNTTRLNVSTENGFSKLGRVLPTTTHHRFLVDENNQFVDAAGNVVSGNQTNLFVNDPNLFFDNDYGVPIYDNIKALFHTGTTMRQNLQLSQNALATNFSVSGGAQTETGVLKTNNGTESQNLGVNIDYRGARFLAGMGLSYARRFTQTVATEDSFLTAADIGKTIDITAIDPATGNYYPFPDGVNGTLFNPLHLEGDRDEWVKRMGAQANGSFTFRPNSILSIVANGGYQRNDVEEQVKWVPPGTLYSGGTIAAGEYDIGAALDESYNGRVRAGILTGMGGWTMRANLATGGTMQKRHGIDIRSDILRGNQRTVDIAESVFANNTIRDIRSLDYSANVSFDYNSKYTIDVLYRRDGSSNLPPETRYSSNGRASLAWLMSEESWWPLASLTLFKPRYSIGTAGNNPPIGAQYEYWSLGTAQGRDRIAKQNLGNSSIVPEEVTEQEFGLDMALNNRYSVQLNYVRNVVKNVIRPDTILAYTGNETQESNLGDLRGDNYEATFEAQWIQSRDLRWSSTLVLDRGRQKITSFPRRCGAAATTTTLNRLCEGYVFGEMYGTYHVTDTLELSPRHWGTSTSEGKTSWFQHNDEGLLVAVGEGGSWTDMRWGQTVSIDGINYGWGLPILGGNYNIDGARTGTATKKIGSGIPDVSFGFGNSIGFKQFTVSIQTVGQLGGQIFNQYKKAAFNREVAAELDQAGKPDYLKKPISYYINSISSSSGTGGLTNNDRSTASQYFLESGDFLKVSELRVQYRLDEGLPILRRLGMTSGSIALVTRDLFTLTKYSGYDPQVSGTSSFTVARTDSNRYPNYKNITASIRLVF